jgi:hypothetical protein
LPWNTCEPVRRIDCQAQIPLVLTKSYRIRRPTRLELPHIQFPLRLFPPRHSSNSQRRLCESFYKPMFTALRKKRKRLIFSQGTLIIVIGVIGIVAFGSINSGLVTAVSLERLQTLWSRGGWLFFFITSFISITLLYLVVTQLDAVLISRSDIGEEPVTLSGYPPNASKFQRAKYNWLRWNYWLRDTLNDKMANKSDKQVAWFLGVGWSLVGGLMAGGCLVFAKAWYETFPTHLALVLTWSYF